MMTAGDIEEDMNMDNSMDVYVTDLKKEVNLNLVPADTNGA